MKSVGLVVEYNPFHNGHKHHLETARTQSDADVVIAVMSGSFLQRGEPALLSRWERTKMALDSGADIIVELPYAYSVQTAKRFAEGAIRILSALGCNSVIFGSEEGNIQPFLQLAHFMEEEETVYNEHVRSLLKEGLSYPRASAAAFTLLNGSDHMLSLTQPNNILGYHYVQAIKNLGSHMEASTIPRIEAGYHDTQIKAGPIASATSIRKAIRSGHSIADVVPSSTLHYIKAYKEQHQMLHYWEAYFPFLQYQAFTLSPKQVSLLGECDEGIEYRLIETGRQAISFEDWLTRLKTKRYTRTKLQRLFTHLLTSTKKDELQTIHSEPLSYIRLLGMSEKGRLYLKLNKKKFAAPLITRQAELNRYGPSGHLDLRTNRCYWLCLNQQSVAQQVANEYKQTPIYNK